MCSTCHVSPTIVRLVEVGRGLEEALEEGGVDLLHGQELDAVHGPVHVVPDALEHGIQENFLKGPPRLRDSTM